MFKFNKIVVLLAVLIVFGISSCTNETPTPTSMQNQSNTQIATATDKGDNNQIAVTTGENKSTGKKSENPKGGKVQSQTIIGQYSGGISTVIIDPQILLNAAQEELNDGTVFTDVMIKLGTYSNWALVISGIHNDVYHKMVLDLDLDDITGTFKFAGETGNYKLCSTTTCINACDWEACSCKSGQPGQVCEAVNMALSNGPGHLGSFY